MMSYFLVQQYANDITIKLLVFYEFPLGGQSIKRKIDES